MNEIVTSGIVLNSMPIGENDRRVEILTRDFGRISAFARGARKALSPLSAATRPFAFGQFTIAKGKTAYNIKTAVIRHYFEELATDLDLACYGFYFLEVSRYFSRENADSEEMLKLLYYSLKALLPEKPGKRLVRCVFELKMLIINGLCPASDQMFSGENQYAFASGACAGAKRAFGYVWGSGIEKLFTFMLADPAMEDFDNMVRRLMEMNTDVRFQSLSLLS